MPFSVIRQFDLGNIHHRLTGFVLPKPVGALIPLSVWAAAPWCAEAGPWAYAAAWTWSWGVCVGHELSHG